MTELVRCPFCSSLTPKTLDKCYECLSFIKEFTDTLKPDKTVVKISRPRNISRLGGGPDDEAS